jgi:AcrR family transcriptional regulator
MPLAARQGLAELSLEDLAARVGVTRNLLYYYFPRGRADVVLAVAEEAERQLSADWVSLDHALAPTHAWRIHRMAAATAADPELRAVVSRSAARRLRVLSDAHLGTSDPAPLAETALRGYIGFAEAAVDHARATGLPRTELAGLLDELLGAMLDAARRAQTVSSASHAAD